MVARWGVPSDGDGERKIVFSVLAFGDRNRIPGRRFCRGVVEWKL
jgi:hypothetical protein